MDDKAPLFDLKDQPPVIQLFASVLVVILAGTLLFHLFVFSGSLIFGTDMSEMLSIPSANASLKEVSILKFIQVSQQITLFFIPAFVISILLRKRKESFLRIKKLPGTIPVFMVIILALLIIPVTSYIGILNSKMDLPGWLSGVEEWIRTKEDNATAMMGLLIKSPGIGVLIINIFILAVIPSIAEEMLFRGVLQQILCRIFRSGHAGIWIAAIIFSTIHFQFFGFLPRLMLGLTFGYLYFWSGNLWLPVIAHFINNAIPVVISYFVDWEELGAKASGLAGKQILLPLVPALLSVVFYYYFWHEYKKNLLGET